VLSYHETVPSGLCPWLVGSVLSPFPTFSHVKPDKLFVLPVTEVLDRLCFFGLQTKRKNKTFIQEHIAPAGMNFYFFKYKFYSLCLSLLAGLWCLDAMFTIPWSPPRSFPLSSWVAVYCLVCLLSQPEWLAAAAAGGGILYIQEMPARRCKEGGRKDWTSCIFRPEVSMQGGSSPYFSRACSHRRFKGLTTCF
jgi:hypothetical protein